LELPRNRREKPHGPADYQDGVVLGWGDLDGVVLGWGDLNGVAPGWDDLNGVALG
jgi:hypothetical protein